VEILIAAAEAGLPGLPGSLRQVVGPAVSAALLAGTPTVGLCDAAHTSDPLSP
jgi:hypothetical protein